MITDTSVLMSFPPSWWWAGKIQEKEIALEIAVPFRKMEWNNRYRIAAANGPLLLSIPIDGGRDQRSPMKDIRIENKSNWQKQHWRSIFSAYGRAPFFEHYAPALEALLHKQQEWLVDFNMEALAWVARELRLPVVFKTISQGSVINEAYNGPLVTYAQVFEDRHGFIPGLSIIDLLMNEGPAAKTILAGQEALSKQQKL